MALTSDDLTYLLEQAEKTLDACEKKYGLRNGLVLENEWELKLDRGRFVIHDRARRMNLTFSSLAQEDVQGAIDTIVKTYNR